MREPDPRWIALLTVFCTRRPSNEEVRAVLSEAFAPDQVLQSGDQLLGDLYFSLLHAATGEEDLTPREAAYFLACLQGRREHTWVDKWRFCYGRPYPCLLYTSAWWNWSEKRLRNSLHIFQQEIDQMSPEQLRDLLEQAKGDGER